MRIVLKLAQDPEPADDHDVRSVSPPDEPRPEYGASPIVVDAGSHDDRNEHGEVEVRSGEELRVSL
jgi:hypothetical protein